MGGIRGKGRRYGVEFFLGRWRLLIRRGVEIGGWRLLVGGEGGGGMGEETEEKLSGDGRIGTLGVWYR